MRLTQHDFDCLLLDMNRRLLESGEAPEDIIVGQDKRSLEVNTGGYQEALVLSLPYDTVGRWDIAFLAWDRTGGISAEQEIATALTSSRAIGKARNALAQRRRDLDRLERQMSEEPV